MEEYQENLSQADLESLRTKKNRLKNNHILEIRS